MRRPRIRITRFQVPSSWFQVRVQVLVPSSGCKCSWFLFEPHHVRVWSYDSAVRNLELLNLEPRTRTPTTNVEHGTRNAEPLSAFQREDIVERLPAPDNLESIVVHEHFRSEEAPVVI